MAAMRHNLRRLTKQKGFTLTVLLTLGLCIGANIAIFAIVDAVLLKPLPYPHADRLVTAYNSYPGAGVEKGSASIPNYFDRRNGAIDAFESVSITQPSGTAIIGEAGSLDRVNRGRVSPEFFDTIGVPLLMGRTFTDDELLWGNSGKAILTFEFWQSYFDGDSEVLGKTFIEDGYSIEVIGILPKGFKFLTSEARYYMPTGSSLEDRKPQNRHSNNYMFVARLKPGVTIDMAQAQMDAFNAVQLETDPFAHLVGDVGFRTWVKDFREDYVAEIKPTLIMLQGGVLCLLLIGGVNIANLFLIRASGRAKEMAVRQALGASRSIVMRDTLYETLTLTLGGGILGLAIGALGIRLMGFLGIDKLPLGSDIALSGRVAIAALIGSAVVGLILAIPVIWFFLKGQIATALQSESRSGTVSRNAQRVRHSFIVAQIALTFLLLTGAGMLSISLKKVMEVSPGFVPDQVLAGRLDLPHKRYSEKEDRLAFIDRLLPAIQSIPGVTSAAITTNLPFSGMNSNNATAVEGFDYTENNSIRAHYNAGVEGEYFKTMGIALKDGRLLEKMDERGDRRVCLIDEEFAAFYWRGESPVGKRVSPDPEFSEDNAVTIVGVVESVKRNDLGDESASGSIYYPYQQQPWNNFSLTIKTAMEPAAIIPTIRRTVLDLDPELLIDGLRPMDTRIEESLTTRKTPALLAGTFAAVALLLAGIGTYGVLAYAVAQRQREVGVRMALGASPARVRSQFLVLGLRLLSVGLTLGLIGTWFIGRVLNGLLFNMPDFHFASVFAAACLMALVSQLACLLPSMRASRVPPTVALSEAGA